jgi:hypothetical protein
VREDFEDAWQRYLPSIPVGSVTSVTSVTEPDARLNLEPEEVTEVTDVTAMTGIEERCPACGSTERWYRPNGSGPVCGVCHPNPARLAMVFAMGAGI